MAGPSAAELQAVHVVHVIVADTLASQMVVSESQPVSPSGICLVNTASVRSPAVIRADVGVAERTPGRSRLLRPASYASVSGTSSGEAAGDEFDGARPQAPISGPTAMVRPSAGSEVRSWPAPTSHPAPPTSGSRLCFANPAALFPDRRRHRAPPVVPSRRRFRIRHQPSNWVKLPGGSDGGR